MTIISSTEKPIPEDILSTKDENTNTKKSFCGAA
jgi:hypothetical protein